MSDLTLASCCGRASILSARTRASKTFCTALAFPGKICVSCAATETRQNGRSFYFTERLMGVCGLKKELSRDPQKAPPRNPPDDCLPPLSQHHSRKRRHRSSSAG